MQLGVLDVIDEGPGQLGEQGVVEVVALVDQVFVQFAQGVLLQVVSSHRGRAPRIWRAPRVFHAALEVIGRFGHLARRKLGKQDSPVFLEVSTWHLPSRSVDYCATFILHDLQTLEKIERLLELVVALRRIFKARRQFVFCFFLAVLVLSGLGGVLDCGLHPVWRFPCRLLFAVVAQVAVKIGFAHAHGGSTAAIGLSSTTMSGVMPLAWMERPDGVK